MKKLLLLLTCFVLLNFSANAYEQGEKFEDGMIFLYREKVEIYWNDWVGKALNHSKVYISGEGKTATFDGVIELNCDSSSGYSWITASTGYDNINTKESDLKNIVPIQVVSAVFEEFCSK